MKPSPSVFPKHTPEFPFSSDPLPGAEPPRAGKPAGEPPFNTAGDPTSTRFAPIPVQNDPDQTDVPLKEAVPVVESSQIGDPVLTGPLVRDPFTEPLPVSPETH